MTDPKEPNDTSKEDASKDDTQNQKTGDDDKQADDTAKADEEPKDPVAPVAPVAAEERVTTTVSSVETKDATDADAAAGGGDAAAGGVASAATTSAKPSSPAVNPKKKRVAERQITKDDRIPSDDDEDKLTERDGNWKADQQTLAKRRIVRAKRPNENTRTENDDDDDKKKKNPFTSILSATSNTSKVFGASTGFSGFKTVDTQQGFNTFGANKAPYSSLFGTASSSTTTFFNSKPEEKEATTTATAETPSIFAETVDLKTGEEDEQVLLELRCKTHKLVVQPPQQETSETTAVARSVPPSAESQQLLPSPQQETDTSKMTWSEVGIGLLRVLQQPKKKDRLRLVQRRQVTPTGPATKVLVNVHLYTANLTRPSEKHVQITTLQDEQPVTLLFKFKLATEAQALVTQIQSSLADKTQE